MGKAKTVSDESILSLCLSNRSQSQIAKTLGITKTQVCRRVNTEEFQAMLTDYRKKMLDNVLTELTSYTQKSVDTLANLLYDDNSFVRLNAAKTILQMTADYSIQKDLLKDLELLKIAKANEIKEV